MQKGCWDQSFPTTFLRFYLCKYTNWYKIISVIYMMFTDTESAKSALKNGENVEFTNKTLVLGSGSMSRAKIMNRAGLNFVVLPSLTDEENIKKNFGMVDSEEKAVKYVLKLSKEKATWLASKVGNAVILSADTIAFYKDRILEKPKDEADARRIFDFLSDTTHIAITGVCIIDGDEIDNFEVISSVRMLPIPEEEKERLIKDKLTYTYAGGYCVDGNLGDKTVVKKEDFSNVMGLPVEIIIKKLKERGYDFSK